MLRIPTDKRQTSMESKMVQNSTSNFSITFNKYNQIQDHIFIKINKSDLIQPKKFNQPQRKVKNQSQSTKINWPDSTVCGFIEAGNLITFKKNKKLCQQIPWSSTNVVDQGDLESEAFLYELLENYQLLQIELNRSESSLILLFTLWNLHPWVALIILEGQNWK